MDIIMIIIAMAYNMMRAMSFGAILFHGIFN